MLPAIVGVVSVAVWRGHMITASAAAAARAPVISFHRQEWFTAAGKST